MSSRASSRRASRTSVRDSERADRESRRASAHADRLVPLGLQHPACVRHPELRVGAGARGRSRPEGFPARTDRARAAFRAAHHGEERELRRGSGAVSDRYRPAAARGRDGRARSRLGRKLPKGHGLGIAAHRSFVSYTAAVCEVQVDADGKITVPRVDIAIDCGPQVNPERVRSQLEGAVVMGLGIALHGEITFRTAIRSRATSTASRCCA